MNRRIMRVGALTGLVGGTTMAVFAMVAMWATGQGLFTVVNAFAGTFWQGAPPDATFAPAAFALGLLIHLVVSVVVGTTIAWSVDRGQLDAGIIILLGVAVGTGAWVVQSVVWAAIDAYAQQRFTPWILATAHLVFALGAAAFLTWRQSTTDVGPLIDPVPLAPHRPSTDPQAVPRPTRAGFSRSFRSSREDG